MDCQDGFGEGEGVEVRKVSDIGQLRWDLYRKVRHGGKIRVTGTEESPGVIVKGPDSAEYRVGGQRSGGGGSIQSVSLVPIRKTLGLY